MFPKWWEEIIKGKVWKSWQNKILLWQIIAVSKGSSVPLIFSRMIDLHTDSVFSGHTSSAVTSIADWAPRRVSRKKGFVKITDSLTDEH